MWRDAVAGAPCLADAPGDGQHEPLSQRRPVAVKAESHKIKRLLVRPAYLPIPLHGQPIGAQPLRNRVPHFVQLLLVAPEDNHVVHVSDVVAGLELLLDPIIHVRQKEVGVHLTEKHPDWQPGAHAEDLRIKRKKSLVLDDPAQLLNDAGGLDAGIKLAHVHFEVILGVLVVASNPLFHNAFCTVDAPTGDGTEVQPVNALEQPRAQG